jgi:hypothetical protein
MKRRRNKYSVKLEDPRTPYEVAKLDCMRDVEFDYNNKPLKVICKFSEVDCAHCGKLKKT